MYPVIRLITTTLRSMRADKIPVTDSSETRFMCRPWDLDIFMEMNNGRVLTLYDLGRFDLAIRTGLSKSLHKNKWGLVVAGSSIRYRRRIRAFDKVTINTRVASIDERWVYIIQSMWVKDQPMSSVLLRTGVTEKGKVIPTEAIKKELGAEDWNPEPADWVKEWIISEAARQWPPER